LAIHPTAIVSNQAVIAAAVEIGPFCVIEGAVSIGEGTTVESHARIGSRYGRVSIGSGNLIQHGAVLGGPAQDYSYAAAETALEIGSNNRIGEYCSVSLGTEKGGGITRIGNDNFLMAFVHLGHDCQLADHIVITNATQLAGHVTVEHHAVLSGLAGVTQFVRLGAYSFLTAGAFANKDIPPFTIAEGHWAVPKAVNRVGLKRAGFGPAVRQNIQAAIKLLLNRSLTIEEVVTSIETECAQDEAVSELLTFIRSSSRGVARG
jgi:UDP-N-acetylglucosamine acyltransferase